MHKKLPCIKKLYESPHKNKKRRNSCGIWEPNPSFKTICFDRGKCEAVRRITTDLGFQEVSEIEYWNIVWTDCPISLEKALKMRRNQDSPIKSPLSKYSPHYLQRANHFPGMMEVCRKDRLASNLNRMQKSFPRDYNFFPRTWSLPTDWADLRSYSQRKRDATYICKPDSGSQGRGIFLVKNARRLDDTAKFIVQKYIQRPFLIDEYKFDLRIYVFITSCDPLRIYIYNEGLARFATIKYAHPTEQNIDVLFMHLTNYSLNKYSQAYVPEDGGSKRKLTDIYKWLLDQNFDVLNLIDQIDQLVIKTMVAVQPTLRHYYRTYFPKRERESACFEILGFDILLDHKLKPYLCEVNHTPSFSMDLLVDAEVKSALLEDMFRMIYLGAENGRDSGEYLPLANGPNSISSQLAAQFQFEENNLGNFRLIYPCKSGDKYLPFFNQVRCPALLDPIHSSYSRSREYTRLKLPDISLYSPGEDYDQGCCSEDEVGLAYMQINQDSDEIKRIKRLRQIVNDLKCRQKPSSSLSPNLTSYLSPSSTCVTLQSAPTSLPMFPNLRSQECSEEIADYQREKELKGLQSRIEELSVFLDQRPPTPEAEEEYEPRIDPTVYAKAAMAAVRASKGGLRVSTDTFRGRGVQRSSSIFKEEWLDQLPMGDLLRSDSRNEQQVKLKPNLSPRKLPFQIAELAKQKVKASVLKMEKLVENEKYLDVNNVLGSEGSARSRSNPTGRGVSKANLSNAIRVSISPYKKPWNSSYKPI